MEIWQYTILLLVGIVVGFVNVMAGGGSLLTIPIMLFMDVPAPVANGTNRIAILAQMATAVVAFFRNGYSDFKLSLTLSLGCTARCDCRRLYRGPVSKASGLTVSWQSSCWP